VSGGASKANVAWEAVALTKSELVVVASPIPLLPPVMQTLFCNLIIVSSSMVRNGARAARLRQGPGSLAAVVPPTVSPRCRRAGVEDARRRVAAVRCRLVERDRRAAALTLQHLAGPGLIRG
jgi:hypothetical protein